MLTSIKITSNHTNYSPNKHYSTIILLQNISLCSFFTKNRQDMTIDERLANTNFPLPAIREVNMAKHSTAISLGLGELSSFSVNPKIFEALQSSLTKGGSNYTHNAGLPELRSAIAKQTNHILTNENVIITIGVQNAIYATIKTLAKLGAKRVLIPEIHFGIYKKIPSEFNLQVITYPLNKSFGVDLRKLEDLIEPDDIVILNSPSNPTGRVFTNNEQADLANIFISKLSNGYVLSDEIYNELIYEGEKPKSFIHFFDRTIVVNGISKSAATAGLRVGWIISNNTKLAKAITSNNATIISSPPTANQYAALPVVNNETQNSIDQYNSILKENCEIACKILDDNNISYNKPKGSFYIFPNMKQHLGEHVKDFCIQTAKQKKGVVVIPGNAFGSKYNIRISLASNDLLEGMNRFIHFLKEYKKNLS